MAFQESLSFSASYGRNAVCELIWNFNPAKLLRIHVSEKFNIIIESGGAVWAIVLNERNPIEMALSRSAARRVVVL